VCQTTKIISKFISLLSHSKKSLNYVKNIDQRGVIDIKVDYNSFNFFDSRWINKGQILLYPFIKLFF